MSTRSVARAVRRRMALLRDEHWDLLERLAAEPEEDEEDCLVIEDPKERGLVHTLRRLHFAELVEEPGQRAGWTVTAEGLAALEAHRPLRGDEEVIPGLPRAGSGRAATPVETSMGQEPLSTLDGGGASTVESASEPT